MALINNERTKKRNRVGTRDLTRRAGQALLELKPCWMMSPLAVAQYLHEGLRFDMLVIDEASQMTPENAIGALRRADQAIVVGDTKQLPPTSFFKKVLDDSEVDEDLREDSESVLDMANNAFSPVRQLRWHYRSLHSGLIQFSNQWMYDNKLTIFPGAAENNPQMGVKLVETGGVYAAGSNPIEARVVVNAVVRHMENSPGLSLGVCTMNTDQKDLILEEFERERDRNRKVQDYVRHWEETDDALQEFFVKNLETIQGDERDVMFISTLYGPEVKGGPVYQRFGPINLPHGDRRLNVLFTRAKSRIETFTSLKASDIRADEKRSKGVRMFKAWLEYSATGHVPEDFARGGEAESPFEDHVLRVIEQMGFEGVPQVGVGGFRIDIGVKHPSWPYGFIMGVECDGASYHSSRSARERDRLRQEILLTRGWELYRIWSTDWFNNQDSEVERLRAILNERLTTLQATRGSESFEQAEEWVDNKPKAKKNSGSSPRIEPETEVTPASQPSPDISSLESLPSNMGKRVQIGSRVTVKKLFDDQEKMRVVLSASVNNPDAGILGLSTPLGEALIDAEEGDHVEYQAGPYIRNVRILQVEDM
jgi:very-short-patch-repair endonuclease